jgi:hypothetical protein
MGKKNFKITVTEGERKREFFDSNDCNSILCLEWGEGEDYHAMWLSAGNITKIFEEHSKNLHKDWTVAASFPIKRLKQ